MGEGPCSRKALLLAYSGAHLSGNEHSLRWSGCQGEGICSHAGGQCVVLCRAVSCCAMLWEAS